jgi:hypothetical protein
MASRQLSRSNPDSRQSQEAVHQPRQRRELEPAGVIPPRPASSLTAQHLVLLT